MSYEVPEMHTMEDVSALLHEWFLSLRRAGFTEYQALVIVNGHVTSPGSSSESE